MDYWNPLWSGVVNSSVWGLPNNVRILWITMLAVKDRRQMVYGSVYALARQANLTEGETAEALGVLESPDTVREEAQEFDGRRVRRIEEDGVHVGWMVLNGQKYQDLMKAAWRLNYRAEWMREFRVKNRKVNRSPQPSAPNNETGAEKLYARVDREGGDPNAEDFK